MTWRLQHYWRDKLKHLSKLSCADVLAAVAALVEWPPKCCQSNAKVLPTWCHDAAEKRSKYCQSSAGALFIYNQATGKVLPRHCLSMASLLPKHCQSTAKIQRQALPKVQHTAPEEWHGPSARYKSILTSNVEAVRRQKSAGLQLAQQA